MSKVAASIPRTLDAFLRSVPVVAKIKMRWGDMDAFRHLNNCEFIRYQVTIEK